MRRHSANAVLVKMTAVAAIAGGLALLSAARQATNPAELERRIDLGKAEPGFLYAVTVSAKDPTQFRSVTSIDVSIADASGIVASKRLHSQDLDFYLTLRPRVPGSVVVTLKSTERPLPEIAADFHRIVSPSRDPAVIAAMPNDKWQTA